MYPDIHDYKRRFLFHWIAWNAIVIIVVYPVGLMFGLMIYGVLGYTMSDWGTPLEQSLMMILFSALLGLSLGFMQQRILKRYFPVAQSWIVSIASGFICVEIIIGMMAALMALNRGEYSFVEGHPLHHALILTICGCVVGLIQLPIVRRLQFRSFYLWPLINAIAWGQTSLVTALHSRDDIGLLITFLLGCVFYGLITGVAFISLAPVKRSV